MEVSVELNFKEFDLNKLKYTNIVISIIDNININRPYIIQNIRTIFNDLSDKNICSINPIYKNKFYDTFIQKEMIYNDYTPEIIQNFIKNDILYEDRERQLIIIDTFFPKAPKSFKTDILDTQKDIRNLIMNNRSYKTSLIIISETLLDLNIIIRSNIDYIFVLLQNIDLKTKEKLYKDFFGMFETFEEFDNKLIEFNKNFKYLVIDNVSPNSNIEECIFFCKSL